MTGDIRHSQTISSIGCDQQFFFCTDSTSEYRFLFSRIKGRPASEQRYIPAHPHGPAPAIFIDRPGDRFIIVVPGTMVKSSWPVDRLVVVSDRVNNLYILSLLFVNLKALAMIILQLSDKA